MIAALAADLCALMALCSLIAFWQYDRSEPLIGDPVFALVGVAMVLAVF